MLRLLALGQIRLAFASWRRRRGGGAFFSRRWQRGRNLDLAGILGAFAFFWARRMVSYVVDDLHEGLSDLQADALDFAASMS